jgi:hypothetical protein
LPTSPSIPLFWLHLPQCIPTPTHTHTHLQTTVLAVI